ncbi:DUF982 domain-containing protein [Rhizobiales bacterium RZME27]|uniref:DUF982 domain-containing protein n=1 Tax=Endobacterium cereale TaxID=2663029 RepID=A0A6A8ABE8_9HYPH|nr:DUF982 domain-containing protein [Endobacterium cereale]
MSIIAVRFSLRWKVPVHVGEDALLTRTVRGPADALRHLKTFSYKSGHNYWRAHDLCQLALTGGVHSEMCRKPFIAACADEDAHRSQDD